MELLEKFQLNAARIGTGATARCHLNKLYEDTKWETLSQRRYNHRNLQMYKIMKGKSPSYLRDLVPGNVEARTRYGLRNRDDIDWRPVRNARIELHSNSFFPVSSRNWNILEAKLKAAPSVESYKYIQKAKLEKPNPLFYFGDRRANIIHARLRIGCSELKAHLHDELHVIESPLCPCGAGVDETPEHFFFECTQYAAARNIFRNNLSTIMTQWPPPIETILSGLKDQPHPINVHLFSIIHQYIISSQRFT
jgi:hypothetical protein